MKAGRDQLEALTAFANKKPFSAKASR